MLTKLRNLLFAAVACTLLASATQAADTPADVFFSVTTKGFDSSINDVESVAAATVKGSPLQMMVMPGVLKMQMFRPNNEFGLTPDFIEADKPASFVLIFDEKRQQPRPVFLLPVGNLAEKLKGLEAVGATAETNDKGITTIHPARGGTNYAMDAGGGYALITESSSYIEMAKSIIGDWRPEASKSTATAKIYSQNIYNKFKSVIDTFPQIMLGEMDKAKNDDMPPALKEALKKAIPLYGDMIVDILRGTDLVEVSLSSSTNGLLLDATMNVKAGSAFEKFNTAFVGTNPKADSLKAMKLLPAKAYQIAATNNDPKVSEFFAPYVEQFSKLLSPAVNETFQVNPAPIFTDSLKINKLILSGNASSSFLGKDFSMEGVSIGFVQEGKQAEAMALIKSSTSEVVKVLDQLKTMFKKELKGVEFNFSSSSKKLGADEVVLFKFNYKTPQNQRGMMPPALMMLQQKAQNKTYCIGIHKNVVIVTFGDASEATWQQTAKAVDSGKGGLPARFVKDFTDSKDDNLLYSALYLNELTKQIFDSAGSITAMVPPQILQIVKKAIGELPNSKTPILTTMGAQKGKFTLKLSLPVSAVKDLYDGGFKTFMQIKMMQMQGGGNRGGGAPAIELEEKEEVDVM